MVPTESKRSSLSAIVASFLVAGCIAVGIISMNRGYGQTNFHLPTASASELEETDAVICKIYVNHVLHSNAGDSHRYHACHPVVNGVVDDRQYKVELPSDIVKMHEEHLEIVDASEDFGVKIPGAVFDEETATISYPNDSAIKAVALPQRKRRLAASTGSQTILIVRVSTPDAGPAYSKDQLYNLVFVGSNSLKDQFSRMSFGKLNVNPTGLYAIDVYVSNMYARSGQYNAIANAASTAANQYLQYHTGVSSVGDYADHVMYILPNSGSWVAYGSVGGETTVYNDRWGAYLSVQAHEIGHNMKLTHANKNGEYLDYTNYMSGAIVGYHDVERGPLECYNAYHSTVLGWYDDKNVVVNPYQPRKLYMAGAVDYGLTTYGQTIVGSVGNIYFMYNRAKGFNVGTYDYKDELLIVQNRGAIGTEFIAGLSLDQPTFQTYDSSTGNTLTIQVCRSLPASQSGQPDLLEVSVGYGGSLCQSASQSSYSGGGGFFSADQAFTEGGVAATSAVACNRLKTGNLCTSDSDCCSGSCVPSGSSYVTYCT